MRKSAILLFFALLGVIVILSGCTSSPSTTAITTAPTLTPQVEYVTVTVIPTEPAISQIPTATTIVPDPVVGRTWVFIYGVTKPANRTDFDVNYYNYINSEKIVFTMDNNGTTNGSIISDKIDAPGIIAPGGSAIITGCWTKNKKDGTYHIAPFICATNMIGMVDGPGGSWIPPDSKIKIKSCDNGRNYYNYPNFWVKYENPNILVAVKEDFNFRFIAE